MELEFFENFERFSEKIRKTEKSSFWQNGPFLSFGDFPNGGFLIFCGQWVLFALEKKFGGYSMAEKKKTWKNWKMKNIRSSAPSQNFFKIPKSANFLANFAPLMLSKLFSTVIFWCRKVPAKISTFFQFLPFWPQNDPQNGAECRKKFRRCDF